MGEFELIAELFVPLATHEGALGLSDDASVLEIPEGQEAVIAKDVMVAGVHFLEGTDPAVVARKLLRVNLSDLAAMGADPLGYWLGVQVPKEGARQWLTPFVEGLRLDQLAFGVSLMGGDTTATPGPVAISLTAMGTVPKGQALKRSGAKAGDRVWVTGTIGDGMLGLKVAQGELSELSEEDRVYLRRRLEIPEPRLGLGVALRGIASAVIDISDGLAADAGHIAEASGASLTIDAGKVPLSAAARRALDRGLTSIKELLSGGDDYELLFTASASNTNQVVAAAKKAGLGLGEIGVVADGASEAHVIKDGTELVLGKAGFTHF